MAGNKLTEEQWTTLGQYYHEGHTLNECAVLAGVTRQTVSAQFKKRGISVREKMEPSTPERAARLKHPALRAKYLTPQGTADTAEATPEGKVSHKKSRKIISLEGNGGKGKMLYEKVI